MKGKKTCRSVMLCCCGDGYFDNQQLGSQFMGSALGWKPEPSSSDVTLPDVWFKLN